MITVENEFVKIAVNPIGAELSSLYNKQANTELLWQGDAKYWAGQAPILFPIVGTLKDNKFTYEGNDYEMPRHGLVRKKDQWQLEKVSDHCIKGTFTSSETTKKAYPFDFVLEIFYTLSETQLEIKHQVQNTGDSKMPFSIGAHPAFNCPVNDQITYADYFLEFEKEENAARHFLNENGIFDGTTAPVLNNTDTLTLQTDLFDADALVFKDLKSKKITLVGPNGKILKVKYDDFKTIGIWATPGAPFICIEPWIGYADTTLSNYNLFDKKDSLSLKAKETYNATYMIEVL